VENKTELPTLDDLLSTIENFIEVGIQQTTYIQNEDLLNTESLRDLIGATMYELQANISLLENVVKINNPETDFSPLFIKNYQFITPDENGKKVSLSVMRDKLLDGLTTFSKTFTEIKAEYIEEVSDYVLDEEHLKF
jgi:hypothetical protein